MNASEPRIDYISSQHPSHFSLYIPSIYPLQHVRTNTLWSAHARTLPIRPVLQKPQPRYVTYYQPHPHIPQFLTGHPPGSFGTHPKQIQKTLRTYQSLAESRPDPFIRYEQPFALDTARTAIADYLRIPVRECVFVKNATTGVNTVLRNLAFAPGDVIIYFDTVYGAVEKTIQSLEETAPARGRKVCYEFPITHEELVERFVETVRKVKAEGCNARVAVFETVVSVPGIRFPWEELVAACKRESVLSLVDGAHGVGMFRLDLGSVQPDFFTSNCHKYVPPTLSSHCPIYHGED